MQICVYTFVWVYVCDTEETGRMRKICVQDSLLCHFQGQCDISAEQWSPMVVVGDTHVTETLTPLVRLTNALLTPLFPRVAVQIQDPHPKCSRHKPLTSSCMFSQQPETKHICTVTAITLCRIIQVLVLKNASTRIIWLSGESSKSEKLRRKLA